MASLIVRRVDNWILWQRVHVECEEDIDVEIDLPTFGRSPTLRRWRIRVKKGERFSFSYPPWPLSKVGVTIPLGEVARSPLFSKELVGRF